MSKPYAGDYISAWISHLCLNASTQKIPHQIAETHFYSPEVSFTLDPVGDADQQLKQLLEYYWQGLHYPLNFFPRTSLALYSKNGTVNISDMSQKWNGNNGYAGEKEKFEHWLLHRDLILNSDQQDDDFMQISEHFFGNMFAHLR